MDQDTFDIHACSSTSCDTSSLESVHLSILTDPNPLGESFDHIDENALSGGTVRLQSVKPEAEEEIDMGIENTWMDETSLSVPPAADFPIPLPPPGGFDDIAYLEPVAPSEKHGSSPESELGAFFTPENGIQGDVRDTSSIPGICGIRNLGNTCFMGAGLQCLAATPSLIQYFLLRHVKEKEPSHSLTSQFASLVHKMWCGQYRIIHPSEFKEALGLSQPQFKDFRQHDCQEFLALLLDSLHEELNTASSKSIVSEGSTAELQSPCEVEDKELRKGILENMDQELTLQTTASLDSSKCNQSSSSRSSDCSSECYNCIRFQAISQNIRYFKETSPKNNGMDVDSEKNEKSFKDNEENADQSVVCDHTPGSCFSNNSLSPNALKKEYKFNGEQMLEKNIMADRLNSVTQCFRGLQDILKDAKTSNVNVLVTEQEANNEIRYDSEKFPKHENLRRRDPLENPNLTEFHNFDSKTICVKRIKETNLLHESVDHAAECAKCFNNIKRIKLEDQEKNFRMERERKLHCFDSVISADNTYSEEASASPFEPMNLNEEIEADKHWENHLALNQSVVVDSFQGQFKSTVVCSTCKHVSVTYEPFMYLSVPLPHAMERQICVTFVPAISNNAVKYLVTLNKQDKVKKLKEQVLSRMGKSSPKNIALAEVLDSHIARILDDHLLLRYVNDANRSIYAFELLSPPGNHNSEQENVIRKRTTRTRRHNTQISKPLDLTPNLNGGGKMSGSSVTSGHGKDPFIMEPIMEEDESEIAPVSSPYEQEDGWKSCAICLEEMDLDLRRHTACSCVLCEPCIETSCRHYGGAKLACPVCGMVVNPETDFVPLNKLGDYKPSIRLLNVPIVFRMDMEGDGNNNKKTMKLFGHPNLVRLPNRLSGEDLYDAVDHLIPYKATYSILFVDGQGYHCSRCMYTMHCRGCRVASKDEVILQTGDTLAVRFTDPVDEKSNSVEHPSMKDLRCRDPLSLYDCLQAFSESEQLDEHNPWYCPVCQKNQCATKTLSVWRYPDFLIVYLKRFVFHECVSLKLENKVTFPLSGLSVTPASILQHDTALPYNLYACVCHFGGSAAGHYTAYSKNPRTNEWHYYNDESVTKQRPQEEDYCNAYVLFYQKQGVSFDLSIPKLFMNGNNSKPNIEQLILDLDSSVERDWQ